MGATETGQGWFVWQKYNSYGEAIKSVGSWPPDPLVPTPMVYIKYVCYSWWLAVFEWFRYLYFAYYAWVGFSGGKAWEDKLHVCYYCLHTIQYITWYVHTLLTIKLAHHKHITCLDDRIIRFISMTHFNSKATPSNDTDYNCHINVVELVWPIIWGSYHIISHH